MLFLQMALLQLSAMANSSQISSHQNTNYYSINKNLINCGRATNKMGVATYNMAALCRGSLQRDIPKVTCFLIDFLHN